jgi:hypothetical protein
MTTRRTTLLALLLAAAPAFAHAGEKVALPNPWKAGRSFDYATSFVKHETSAAGQHVLETSSDLTRVTITRVDPKATHQVWTQRDPHLGTLLGDAGDQPIRAAFVDALTRIGVEVAVDPRGRYLRIENAERIGAQLRSTVRPVAMAHYGTMLPEVDPGVRATQLAELGARVDASFEATTSPQAIESLLGATYQDLTRFVGGELEAGISHADDTTVATPFSTTSLPARIEYALLTPAPGATEVEIEWRRRLDVGRGREALWDLSDAMTHTTTSAEQRIGMPPGIAHEDTGTARFDRASGTLVYWEQTEHRQHDGKTTATHSRMVLVGQAEAATH